MGHGAGLNTAGMPVTSSTQYATSQHCRASGGKVFQDLTSWASGGPWPSEECVLLLLLTLRALTRGVAFSGAQVSAASSSDSSLLASSGSEAHSGCSACAQHSLRLVRVLRMPNTGLLERCSRLRG